MVDGEMHKVHDEVTREFNEGSELVAVLTLLHNVRNMHCI